MNKKYFFIVLALCLGWMLFNLDLTPIAWSDETYFIDPAYQWIKTGKLASKIWPFENTENIVVAYLPLNLIAQIPFVKFFPPELFYLRLLYFLSFISFLAIVYKIITRIFSFPSGMSNALLLVFLFDEGFNRAMRSSRVEPLSLLLLAACYYLYKKIENENSSKISLNTWLFYGSLGLLSITHPSVWPIAGVFYLYSLFLKTPLNSKIIGSILAILPLVGYAFLANFDFALIKSQLFEHALQHQPSVVEGNLVFKNFVQRLSPTYFTQPWMFVIFVLITIHSIVSIVKNKFSNNLLEISFLVTFVVWSMVLAPHYRYTVSIVFVALLIVLKIIKQKEYEWLTIFLAKTPKLIFYLLLIVISIPFIVRNGITTLQINERKPAVALSFIEQTIGNYQGKILLVDEAVALLYTMNHDQVEYTLPYSIFKFNYQDFDYVFYITHRSSPKGLELINKLQLREHNKTLESFSSKTYEGLKIYKINSDQEFKLLQR